MPEQALIAYFTHNATNNGICDHFLKERSWKVTLSSLSTLLRLSEEQRQPSEEANQLSALSISRGGSARPCVRFLDSFGVPVAHTKQVIGILYRDSGLLGEDGLEVLPGIVRIGFPERVDAVVHDGLVVVLYSNVDGRI